MAEVTETTNLIHTSLQRGETRAGVLFSRFNGLAN
jgi:hypothetical protein